MPIIEGFDAVLPTQNREAPGGVIKKEIIYSGFSIDGRTLSTSDIKELYNNTKKEFLAKSILVKVKVGHSQEQFNNDEKLRGFVKRLELHESPSDSGKGVSIYADLHLYPEVYTDWKDGRFPEVSIANYTLAKDKEGNDIPQIIEHVALLGASRAANPDSKEGSLYSALVSMLKRMNIFANINKEVLRQMDPEKLLELATAINEASAMMIKELTGSEGEETEEAEKEADDTEEEQEERSNSVETTKAFSKLVDEGKISPDERTSFDSLVDRSDLGFAIKHYSSNKALTPPKDKEVTSNRDEKDLQGHTKSIRSLMASMGKSEADIEKQASDIAKGMEV